MLHLALDAIILWRHLGHTHQFCTRTSRDKEVRRHVIALFQRPNGVGGAVICLFPQGRSRDFETGSRITCTAMTEQIGPTAALSRLSAASVVAGHADLPIPALASPPPSFFHRDRPKSTAPFFVILVPFWPLRSRYFSSGEEPLQAEASPAAVASSAPGLHQCTEIEVTSPAPKMDRQSTGNLRRLRGKCTDAQAHPPSSSFVTSGAEKA